ncbi:MAG: thioredoxin family protein [Bradymonadia bacterium]
MARTPSTMMPLGTPMPRFELKDASGCLYTNADHTKKGTLIMFLSVHCPFVIHLKAALADLARSFDAELKIYGIMSNDVEAYPADAPEHMQEDVNTFGYPFPYLIDDTQDVAKAFQAACTPDFFLFDQNNRLFYRGQFDGSRPGNEIAVTGTDLKRAIQRLLDDAASPDPQLPSLGCNIKWKAGNEPDYFG